MNNYLKTCHKQDLLRVLFLSEFRFKALTLVLILLPFVCDAQKNQVYFPFFELINLEQDGELQYSSSRLYKTYIEANHPFSVTLPEHNRSTYRQPLSVSEILKEARQANAELALVGEIHNLDGNFIISISAYDVKSSEKKYADLIKGLTSEDLDPLLTRLGRTFMSKTKARDDIEIGEVSSYEQQGVELQQIQANHYFGVGVGGNVLLGERTLSGLGVAYTFDASPVLFNVSFDYYFSARDEDASVETIERMELGSFNLGVNYPLSRKRMTWMLVGGMDYSFIELFHDDVGFEGEGTGGIGGFGGVGYLMNRNSTVNLKIQVLLHLPSYRIDGKYYPSIRFGITTSIAK